MYKIVPDFFAIAIPYKLLISNIGFGCNHKKNRKNIDTINNCVAASQQIFKRHRGQNSIFPRKVITVDFNTRCYDAADEITFRTNQTAKSILLIFVRSVRARRFRLKQFSAFEIKALFIGFAHRKTFSRERSVFFDRRKKTCFIDRRKKDARRTLL